MKYYILLRRNGNCICGVEQKEENDSIGPDTLDNIFINGIILFKIPKEIYDRFEIDKLPASNLGKYLTSKGIVPY